MFKLATEEEEDDFEYDNEEEEKKNEEWWNNLSDKEQDEYIKYWDDMDKMVEESKKNKPPRPKVLPFEDIEELEEMDPEEREQWLKQKYAELLSIADFLDKKGSFEIADYIDILIKKANKVSEILHLFHHIHHNDKEHTYNNGGHKVHHCGGKHPNSKYNIKHCKCGKHMIDKEEAIGHATDKNIKPFEVKVRFKEKCPEGGWHIESGEKIK